MVSIEIELFATITEALVLVSRKIKHNILMRNLYFITEQTV